MLTQQQRIELSAKAVAAPDQIGTANAVKQEIVNVEIPKAQELDDANNQIILQRTPVINGYQTELTYLDGNARTQLVEQDYVNAVDRTFGNFLFYNLSNTPTPSVPDGIWKGLSPFLLGYAQGRNYQESFAPATFEGGVLEQFNTALAVFEGLHPMEQATGQRGVTNPTPPPASLIEAYPLAQTTMAQLVSAMNLYRALLQEESAALYVSDYNLTRQAQSLAAKDYLDNVIIPAVDLWLSYGNFNTSHGQATSAGFCSYNPDLLQPAKGNPAQLQALKDAIQARGQFVTSTRRPQLESYLGSIAQNLASGDIISQSGLYGERALGIVMRINSIGGSLVNLRGLQSAIEAQDNIISFNQSLVAGVALSMAVSKFIAPATNTATIHVQDASGFSAGDQVYVCADGQAEVAALVVSVAGSRVDLDVQIPQKYTPLNNSRLYKLL